MVVMVIEREMVVMGIVRVERAIVAMVIVSLGVKEKIGIILLTYPYKSMEKRLICMQLCRSSLR